MIREVFRALLNIYDGDICGNSFSIVDISKGPITPLIIIKYYYLLQVLRNKFLILLHLNA